MQVVIFVRADKDNQAVHMIVFIFAETNKQKGHKNMIGALVGAGVSAVGSILGGISASRARKKARQRLERQQKENESWYDMRSNEDATQRADAQRMLTMTQESIKNRNKAAAGTQAVMGGTDESAAATKQANNEALASTASAIAASGEARKDSVEQQYRNTKANLNAQQNNYDLQTAQNTAAAIGGVADAAGSLAAAYSGDSAKNAKGVGGNAATDPVYKNASVAKRLSLAEKLAMTGMAGGGVL